MINKKNVLGKHPEDLGVKDAIHVAIVSVRAGAAVKPGQRCGLNEFNEAVPKRDGVGVADPFLGAAIGRGESFWLLIAQDEIPNVRHDWDHPSVAFQPPTREINRNKYLEESAVALGVSYDQLMDACAKVVASERPVPYPGTKSPSEVAESESDHRYDVWSEWADETGYAFQNNGTECCPEYAYPDQIFDV